MSFSGLSRESFEEKESSKQCHSELDSESFKEQKLSNSKSNSLKNFDNKKTLK
jgi:hypothetical protein